MMEVLKTLPRFFIETLKGMRKLAIYQESRFLEERHRQIYFSQYKFEESILPHKICKTAFEIKVSLQMKSK